jgi:hypothetical protein
MERHKPTAIYWKQNRQTNFRIALLMKYLRVVQLLALLVTTAKYV